VAGIAAASAVVSALAALVSAAASRHSAATTKAALRSNLRPILISDGTFEASEQLARMDTGIPSPANVLKVENVGLGPALNVVANARLYYMGFASAAGSSFPRNLAVGQEGALPIFQTPRYDHAPSTRWEVRITYSDANGSPYWAALDYGRRELVHAESGAGPLPLRFRWFEEVADWENGPTVTYSFVSRQAVRIRLASQRLAWWFVRPRGRPFAMRSWQRVRSLPRTLQHLLRGPEEWQSGRYLKRRFGRKTRVHQRFSSSHAAAWPGWRYARRRAFSLAVHARTPEGSTRRPSRPRRPP